MSISEPDSVPGPGQRSDRALPVQSGRPRLATALRSSQSGLLILALFVGAGAGGGAVGFRWLIREFTVLLSGHGDYSAVGHAANPHMPWLGRWFVVLTPVLAGLVYGPLVHFFAREARGHGVPEVMFAVARRGGKIRPQVAAVKAFASALCIGGGGSVGREGPIVQIGAALGSAVGGLTRTAESRRRVLVACGAAAGIAATFNAPLAGVFFAMELILRDFAAESFGMVVLSSVTASVIARGLLGNDPFLTLPHFTVEHAGEYLLFAVLGLVAGAVGVGFTKTLYLVEDACDWAWRGPEWLRPAMGGLLLGGLLLLLPQMYGVGYPVLGEAVAGHYALTFLMVLLLGKMLATSLTIGIGGSGGVFAPSLFIGAMLGAGYGQGLDLVAPSITGAIGAYALIGMGATFAGAARAPITAVIILFELTGEYSIILPLMAAIVLATGVSHLLTGDSIYTLKLRRRGVDLEQAPSGRTMRDTTVAHVLSPVGPTLPDDARLMDAVERLADAPHGQLPLVDRHHSYLGVVTARTVAETLADGSHDDAPLSSVVEQPTFVNADQSLETCLDALESTAASVVPVLEPSGQNMVGWLSAQQVLSALRAGEGAGAPAGAGSR